MSLRTIVPSTALVSAPFDRRAFACLFDSFLLVCIKVVYFVSVFLLLLAGTLSVEESSSMETFIETAFWKGLSVFWMVILDFSFGGATPGKWLLGIQLVAVDGRALTTRHLLSRSIVVVVGGGITFVLEMLSFHRLRCATTTAEVLAARSFAEVVFWFQLVVGFCSWSLLCMDVHNQLAGTRVVRKMNVSAG
jgi:uncharacterized RDD family membrane protein YckC